MWLLRLSDNPLFRIAGWVFVLINIGLFAFFWSDRAFLLTPDSASYLLTAENYLTRGLFYIEPSRTPGYPVLIWLVAMVSGVDTVAELVPIVAWVQAVGYMACFGLLMVVFGRYAGLVGVMLVALLFAADHYNIVWVKSIQSEVGSRFALFAAIGALSMAIRHRSFTWLAGSLLLIGIAPLFRPSDVVFPLGALLGLMVYGYCHRPMIGRAVVATVVLIGPFCLLIGTNGFMHGVFSPDTRSQAVLVSRALALASTDKLASTSIDPRIIEKVARPVHDAYLASGPLAIPVSNDLQQEDGTNKTYCPMDRRGVSAQIIAAAPDLFDGLNNYGLAAALQDIGKQAFFADPIGYLNCTRHVMWDYVRLPVVRPFKDYSLRNKSLIIPVLLPFAVALFFLVVRKSVPVASTAIVIACIGVAIAHWILFGMLNTYVVRLAQHPWLPLALAASLAWLTYLLREPDAEGRE